MNRVTFRILVSIAFVLGCALDETATLPSDTQLPDSVNMPDAESGDSGDSDTGQQEDVAEICSVEICDGLDNDCDGYVDEALDDIPCVDPESTLKCGGKSKCVEGILLCAPIQPGPELCDGLDNDCDGEVDEDYPELDEPCDGPDPDLCEDGIQQCRADKKGTVCVPGNSGPGVEVCDGIDNDCDGQIDNAPPEACSLTNVFGSCIGHKSCKKGKSVCDAQIPWKESCDGVDNDCDGEVDETFPDSDEDGIADCMEEGDVDDDGVDNATDNCVTDWNPTQLDTDEDGKGNKCDLDDDGDGDPDDHDCDPLDADIYSDAPEICDNKDNDCDNLVDEDGACT